MVHALYEQCFSRTDCGSVLRNEGMNSGHDDDEKPFFSFLAWRQTEDNTTFQDLIYL